MVAGFSVKYRNKTYQTLQGALDASAADVAKPFRQLGKLVRDEMMHTLELTAAQVIRDFRKGTKYNWGGPNLYTRKGRAVSSIRKSPTVSTVGRRTYEGRIGGVHYLRVHEFGGMVTAKKGKYVAIPLPAAKDSRGAPLRESPSQWPNTFVKRARRGPASFVMFQKRGPVAVPLYLLFRQVYLKPRLGMWDKLNKNSYRLSQVIMNKGEKVLTSDA